MNGQLQSSFTGVGTAYLHTQLIIDVVRLLVGGAVSATARFHQLAVAEREYRHVTGHLREILQSRGYRGSTARKYSVCVERFLGSVGVSELADLRDDDVSTYLEDLRADGLSNATLRLHLCAIRAVFDRLLGFSITSDIKHVPRPAMRPSATAGQIRELRRACRSSRDRFVIDLLNGLKLRPAQLVCLAFEAQDGLYPDLGSFPDVELGRCGSKILIPLVDHSVDSVDGSRWLLPSPRSNSGISTRTLQRIVERLSRSCGFHVTCTAIRLAERVPLRSVA